MPSDKRTNVKKPYTEMTPRELKEATSEFDADFVADTFGPPTASAKAQDVRARKRLVGRPRVGQGAARVLITVERGLLARTDALARRRGISRSELIAEGLRRTVSGTTAR